MKTSHFTRNKRWVLSRQTRLVLPEISFLGTTWKSHTTNKDNEVVSRFFTSFCINRAQLLLAIDDILGELLEENDCIIHVLLVDYLFKERWVGALEIAFNTAFLHPPLICRFHVKTYLQALRIDSGLCTVRCIRIHR